MHVEESGTPDGRPVVFLHGGGVGGWMWRPTTDLLPGIHGILPDLPGHDRSAGMPYASHAETVQALADMVERRAGEPLAVVGFSLGAQLAVLLAAQRPDLVARVVVVSAQAIPTRAAGPLLGMLRAAAPLARIPSFARLQARELFVPPTLMDDYLRTSALVSASTLVASVGENIRFTVPPRWTEFPGRALVLAGSRERGFMRQSARVLHRALPGSELQIVEGCGHGMPLQRPEWFAQRLDAWLALPDS